MEEGHEEAKIHLALLDQLRRGGEEEKEEEMIYKYVKLQENT
jgi:hypothetical protein